MAPLLLAGVVDFEAASWAFADAGDVVGSRVVATAFGWLAQQLQSMPKIWR